mmetsp:Transcript_39744/g.65073  ORF Transcript_39744/g.65073 Transcript_39744/m.65073 type:complete len:604 (-) Transcript_39744:133-1944(-)
MQLLCLFVLFLAVALGEQTILTQVARISIPNSGLAGAENIAMATELNRMFTADGAKLGVNVLSFNVDDDDDVTLAFETEIFFTGDVFIDLLNENITIVDVTSVAYSPYGYIFACIVPLDYAQFPGYLAVIDAAELDVLDILLLDGCFLPDNVQVASEGDLVIVSCEGEPGDNTAANPLYNPAGSVMVIEATPDGDISSWSITNVGFTAFDAGGAKHGELPTDIYLPHADATVSQNVEPEYAACDTAGAYCYVALQENNAIAVLDVASKELLSILSMGVIDFSESGLDASDRDGMINIQTYSNLYGLRAPDAVAYFSLDGVEYIVTANEGDSKDFDESRVKDLVLDEDAFHMCNITELQQDEMLGRLKVINQLGIKNESAQVPVYEELYALSSRDFTVFSVFKSGGIPQEISLVYSSLDEFEQNTAAILGEPGFNSNEYPNPSFDARSDDKGPEPECVTVGKCANGRVYVFIGLERVGGVMVYEATNIGDDLVEYKQYINSKNFSYVLEDDPLFIPSEAGDVSPEHMQFVDESVYGVPLLVVAYSESASVAVYRVDCEEFIITTAIESTETTDPESENEDSHANMLHGVSTFSFLFVVISAVFV